MEYIIKNWSELNLIDRAWFLVGAWLLFLFLGVFGHRLFRFLFPKKPRMLKDNPPGNPTNSNPNR
jgi:hypothetical protein